MVCDGGHDAAHSVNFAHKMTLRGVNSGERRRRRKRRRRRRRTAHLAHSAYTRITRQLPDTGSLVRDHQRASADASGGGGSFAACRGGGVRNSSLQAARNNMTTKTLAVVLAECSGT